MSAKDPDAVKLGKKGGARRRELSPEERSAITQKGRAKAEATKATKRAARAIAMKRDYPPVSVLGADTPRQEGNRK